MIQIEETIKQSRCFLWDSVIKKRSMFQAVSTISSVLVAHYTGLFSIR